MTDLEPKDEDIKESEVPLKEDGKESQEPGPWKGLLSCTWKTPLGFFGVSLTTISITLIVLGLIGHITGLIANHYFAIFTFLFLLIVA